MGSSFSIYFLFLPPYYSRSFDMRRREEMRKYHHSVAFTTLQFAFADHRCPRRPSLPLFYEYEP
ncbi:uncharacterized protein DS421_14g469040 [Arachis hypogaea]|nr:uncharacterized protein DS421_14g469040 [Arachis hypogaea]